MAESRICKIEECRNPAATRGWCNSHYLRWRRHGDPLGGGTPNAAAGEPGRYLKDTVLAYDGDECLIWPFAKAGKGYGVITQDGKQVLVHRIVCRDAHGEAPTPEHEVAHSCGNGFGGCVARRHLRWATRAENIADKHLHGTMARGERQGAAKLKESDISAIKRMAGYRSQRQIAKTFNISQRQVGRIIHDHSWAWLNEA